MNDLYYLYCECCDTYIEINLRDVHECPEASDISDSAIKGFAEIIKGLPNFIEEDPEEESNDN